MRQQVLRIQTRTVNVAFLEIARRLLQDLERSHVTAYYGGALRVQPATPLRG